MVERRFLNVYAANIKITLSADYPEEMSDAAKDFIFNKDRLITRMLDDYLCNTYAVECKAELTNTKLTKECYDASKLTVYDEIGKDDDAQHWRQECERGAYYEKEYNANILDSQAKQDLKALLDSNENNAGLFWDVLACVGCVEEFKEYLENEV